MHYIRRRWLRLALAPLWIPLVCLGILAAWCCATVLLGFAISKELLR